MAETYTAGPDGFFFLYKFFTADHELIYVGATENFNSRRATHKSRSPWWPLVDHCEVIVLTTREDIIRAELDAIRDEKPLENRRLVAIPNMRHGEPRLYRRNDYFPVEKAAEILGVSRATVLRAIWDGHISPEREDRKYYIAASEIERLRTPA